MKISKINESIDSLFFEDRQDEYKKCIHHLTEIKEFWEGILESATFYGCTIDRNYGTEKIIVSSCIKRTNGIYRITYFMNEQPVMHENYETIPYIAEKLADFSLHDDLFVNFQSI